MGREALTPSRTVEPDVAGGGSARSRERRRARARHAALALAVVLAGCVATGGARPAAERATPPPAARVQFRPDAALPALGPDARVDKGLRAAAEELAAQALRPDARLAPGAVRLALARAGYPGDARFVRYVGDEVTPQALLRALPQDTPVDVAWAWRDLPDGRRWWVLGWAPRRLAERTPVGMDPVPRDLPLDGAFPLRVEGVAAPRLLISAPAGEVTELDVTPGVPRWVDVFHEPGQHRVEVVDGDRVALLFSVFVEAGPDAPAPLPGPVAPVAAEDAERELLAALEAFRTRTGRASLRAYGPFVPHARAHAACLASAGIVAHATPSCPGVASLARATHFPLAHHRENVAAAETPGEAWERILASPGHLQNLLCTDCTHVSIGVARDAARLFVTWELLRFPNGLPAAIPQR